MSLPACLLIETLLAPERAPVLTMAEWETLIGQARASQLLIRLATLLREQSLLQDIPPAPRRHLESSLRLHQRQLQAVRWEVEHLMLAFRQAEIPLVLLKGAAYAVAELPPGRCRMFSDFDVLVRRDQLERIETILMMHGWSSADQNEYDQRYYRTWMHELPPLRHILRQSVIDVHHNLIPDTARLRPDPERLLAASVPCAHRPEVRVLCGKDMILHSAVHLFHDGEFDHALRDLFDIRDLVAHFITDEDRWRALIARAEELKLSQPLHYALRYLQRTLGVTIPHAVHTVLRRNEPGKLGVGVQDSVFGRGLLPKHGSCDDRLSGLARTALYIRGHALRMPPRLLLPHLLRKALMRSNLLADPAAPRRQEPLAGAATSTAGRPRRP